jgi:hypothetical protein
MVSMDTDVRTIGRAGRWRAVRRTGRRLRGVTLSVAIAGAVLATPVGSATALCAAESGPDGSPVIFTGTVTENRRGYTRLAVEQVYAGPDLAPAVWVRSGQRQPLLSVVGVASSVDADLLAGQTYVIGATREFDTSACSVADLDADDQRSDVASGPPRAPRPDGLTGAEPPLSASDVTGATAAVVSACLVLWGLSRLRLHRRAHRGQI